MTGVSNQHAYPKTTVLVQVYKPGAVAKAGLPTYHYHWSAMTSASMNLRPVSEVFGIAVACIVGPVCLFMNVIFCSVRWMLPSFPQSRTFNANYYQIRPPRHLQIPPQHSSPCKVSTAPPEVDNVDNAGNTKPPDSVTKSTNDISKAKIQAKKHWAQAKEFLAEHLPFTNMRSGTVSGATTPALCHPSPPRFLPELSRVASAESMTESEYVAACRKDKDKSVGVAENPHTSLRKRPSTLSLRLPSMNNMFRTRSRQTPGGAERASSDPTSWAETFHARTPSLPAIPIRLPSLIRRKSEIMAPSSCHSSEDTLQATSGVDSVRTSEDMPRKAAPAASRPSVRRTFTAPPKRTGIMDTRHGDLNRKSTDSQPRNMRRRASSRPPQSRARTVDRVPPPVTEKMQPNSGPQSQRRCANCEARVADSPEPARITTTFVNPFKPKPRRTKTQSLDMSDSDSHRSRHRLGNLWKKVVSRLHPARRASVSSPPPSPRTMLRTQPYGPPYNARTPGDVQRTCSSRPNQRSSYYRPHAHSAALRWPSGSDADSEGPEYSGGRRTVRQQINSLGSSISDNSSAS
ncbi:hypothetical protein WOLCODRAFT_135597 [Wolfiporia cocos MD-104 SS10]|uniref:Uncharacterized protein n=1 Tax=Wolfiporia cocos (strain MD-104) TaxID=742152 RepID=A0A2H3J687_WOLCO|nr:hypothetical protein WOLCODRAFT_135597 [Wolfiporia cocos MD-104 SS10]